MRFPVLTTALLGLGLLIGCNHTDRPAKDTVALYLTCLKGKDPMRALSLFAPEYHLLHGMLFTNTPELPDEIVPPEFETGTRLDRDFAIERGRLGWLFAPAQMGRAHLLFPELANVQLAWMGEQETDRRASVGLRAWVEDEASVDFTFRLERAEPGAAWKIHAIETVSDGSWKAHLLAYVIAPSFEGVEVIRREAERVIREDRATLGNP
ncbi:MAG: hypothetical protein GY944_01995 [bacterium]|nr:hypothetical protein [bacterium]MCP5039770.1 hypothetical protein [bacterium]